MKKYTVTLFKYNSEEKRSFLRIRPLNVHGAPARGAKVILNSNLRNHAKTIDAGSGYLCQMEPVAHYGIRESEKNISVKIVWTDGSSQSIKINEFNKTIEVNQKK